MRFFAAILFFLALAAIPPVHAQFDEESSAGGDPGEAEVEALYDKLDSDQEKREAQKRKKIERAAPKDVKSLSDLSTLAPFSDVAVIQRRFLPRTQRFELTALGMTSINNPFYNNLGVNFRAAYFLTEKHGIELQYSLLSATARSVTENLRDKRNVATSNLVKPKSFMGGAYKWTPVFGKITFLNKKIVPFDLFFTGGFGLTETQHQSEPTLHIGTGQSFALSKSWAFRWDLIWNYYQAEVENLAVAGTKTKTNQSDLFLAFGLSFFFPEASYR